VTLRRGLWLLLALLVTVVLLATAALVLLPRYARQVALWQLRSFTGRPVAIQALDLSLATGEFSVRGLRVTDRDGGVLAELDRLEGRFHRRSLLRLHLWIESLTLTNAHVRVVRVGPGRFNISDLLDRPASGRRLLDVSVDRFTIAGGWVALEDRLLTPARTWRSDDIRLDARDVTTLAPRGTAVGSTTIAGALVTLRVEELQLVPVHLRASVNLRDLDLRLPALYVPADGPVTLERGTVDAAFNVVVDAKQGTSVDADAVVEQLALGRRGLGGDALTAPALRLMIRELRQRPGSIALRYASVGGDVTAFDPTTTPPRPLTFSDLTVTASGIEQLTTGLAQIAAHANVPGGGEVDLGGTAGLTPRRADVRVRARGIELASLARYLPMQGRLAGVGTADVRVVASDEKAFGLTVTGDARVDRLALADGSRTLAGAARVAATGLAYTWPARVAVGQLTVTQPAATVERDAAGAISLAALLHPLPEPTAAAAPTPSARSAPAPDIRIAQLKVDDGRATLSDAVSASRVDVKGLAVSARNVTWPGSGAADLELSASVAGAAVSARGTVDAAKRRAEIALGVGGADLAVLQPWLPLTARVRGALSRADLRVTASHDGTLALTVAGDATLERLTLSAGAKTPVSVARVTAKGIDYTWPATVRVADLTLTQPSVAVERDAAGTLSLMTLARPATADRADAVTTGEAAPGAATDVTITRLRIDDGRVSLADATTGGATQVTRIAFAGEDVTWPARGMARVRLTGDVAGGQLTARGTVDGAQQRNEIDVTLRGADLAALQPWLPIVGRVRGAADADVKASVELSPFTLSARGSLGVANLAFLDGTRPLLTVARVDAAGIDLRWPASLAIDRLRVNTPWALVERNPMGELSLRALFARRPDSPATVVSGPVAAGPVPGLELSVREALFDNGGVNIVDDAVEPAARFELRGSRLEVRNLSWPARGAAAVQMSTPMPGSGTLKARGTLSIEPTRLQLDAELDQVDLAPGRPYLPFEARLNGKVSGRAKISGTFADTITLVVDGDAAVDRLALGDADRRLATAQRAELTGLRYQYPTSVRIRQVALNKPWVLIERNSDGSIAVASLLTRRRPPSPSASESGTGTAPVAAPAAGVRVAITTLSLSDGFLRFVDRTTNPDYAEELTALTLTVEGLGTNPQRQGTLDLRAVLASGHPLTVRGQIGALTGPRFLDLTVAVKDVPVRRFNPYLDRLSSWIARQGSMTASLRYKLAGDDLEASNDITLNGLDLEQGGRGSEVQRRVGLPLGLLVSLLKDRQGNIHLDIPVRGRLSAPDFDYSQAMWTAIRGLAIKLVSLPFSWVGQMFYTEDARIDSIQVFPVPFEVARAAPTSAGRDQLQRLVTFLKEQPAIRLRLRPVTTVADVTALRREALDERLSAHGTDAAARRQAAVAIYTELFPRRQPPASDEALLEELIRETPPPPRALRTLATERTAAVRDGLVQGGVAADRLEPAESRSAVESEGDGRVEFEIAR
jgi:uncharacterized protein involved in outer membrane biogenesis